MQLEFIYSSIGWGAAVCHACVDMKPTDALTLPLCMCVCVSLSLTVCCSVLLSLSLSFALSVFLSVYTCVNTLSARMLSFNLLARVSHSAFPRICHLSHFCLHSQCLSLCLSLYLCLCLCLCLFLCLSLCLLATVYRLNVSASSYRCRSRSIDQ